MEKSVSDNFIILTMPPPDAKMPVLAMNLLEMWCCLMFQTLPEESLKQWIDDIDENMEMRAECYPTTGYWTRHGFKSCF